MRSCVLERLRNKARGVFRSLTHSLTLTPTRAHTPPTNHTQAPRPPKCEFNIPIPAHRHAAWRQLILPGVLLCSIQGDVLVVCHQHAVGPGQRAHQPHNTDSAPELQHTPPAHVNLSIRNQPCVCGKGLARWSGQRARIGLPSTRYLTLRLQKRSRQSSFQTAKTSSVVTTAGLDELECSPVALTRSTSRQL